MRGEQRRRPRREMRNLGTRIQLQKERWKREIAPATLENGKAAKRAFSDN